jgi:cation:H+ antiporter
MGTELSLVAFVLGGLVSLATSWVLVSRLERVGERLGLSEALLGMAAALAADAPEVTASVTALIQHQQTVGAGVIVGSNVFNLAALLGFGAVVSGAIVLHRKVVLFGGAVATVVSLVCFLVVAGVASPELGLLVALVVVVPYIGLLGTRRRLLGRLRLPPRWVAWLTSAIVEEETELEVAIHPRPGTRVDALVALVALITVVGASIAMEQGATSLGRRYGMAEVVVGALVLAAVTSLPNAVSAVFLARRGRGAAALSTALNSNTINVVAGLLVPAAVLGLAQPSASGLLIGGWYVGTTALTLLLAYLGRGLGRLSGWLIIGTYVLFVVAVLAST